MMDKIWIQTPQCVVCWKNGLLQVDEAEWVRYQSGVAVQRAFSNSPDEREQIMTGIHPGCWQEFPKEE